MMLKNNQLKKYLLLGVIVTSVLLTAIVLTPPVKSGYSYELKTFSSYDEIGDFLFERYQNIVQYGYYPRSEQLNNFMDDSSKGSTSESSIGGSSVDFSETNIQVEGVDEPDIVKTDGSYLYIVSGSNIVIVRGYPTSEVSIASKISLPDDQSPITIFIKDDHLVIFSNFYDSDPYQYNDMLYRDIWWGASKTIITIYDINDRYNPLLEKDIRINGSYFNSRLIDNYVYVIITEYSSNFFRVIDDEIIICKPEISIDGNAEQIPPDQIYIIDTPDFSDTMTHILSVNIQDGSFQQKSFMLGSSQNMYVSSNNIFLAYPHYAYFYDFLKTRPGEDTQKTILHKISIDALDISYVAQGEVDGIILNQFSMDEYNGFFRIATTIGSIWAGSSTNNVFILDENLKLVSSIQDIAPGERIYSSRFMGSKAYLVTFKDIDPFFTIDLSDPYNPQILGELKIPGYSDYLHPYDENHIIGIGKDAVAAEGLGRENFAWYQGLKIALFDVSDFENPVEVSNIIIGDRGTDSPALWDHKAFLFDKDKQLLVIPIRLCEISDEIKFEYEGDTAGIYGECTFQGAYVYRLSVEDGFDYQGRITHITDEEELNWYWYWGPSTITRSLYIDTVLYTISESMVKLNDIDSLQEITNIDLT
ncbi:MAG: beta-propeller domain-containing protein [Thermoplasmatota archaeon]